MNESLIKLKQQILLATFFVILIISGARLYEDYIAYNQILQDKQRLARKMFYINYDATKEHVFRFVKSRAIGLSTNKIIAKAMKDKDRTSLLSEALFKFDILKNEDENLVRMHFATVDGYSFLRVHDTNSHGDYLLDKKKILRDTISSRQMQSGFEFGTKDADDISYRVSEPIFYEGEFVGVLELAYDFKNVLASNITTLGKFLNNANMAQYIVLFNKDAVKQLGLNTLIKYKKDFYISQQFLQKSGLLDSYDMQTEGMLKAGQKTYYIFSDDSIITNHLGNENGRVVVFLDVTKDIEQFKSSLYKVVIKPILVLILLTLLFNWLFNKFLKTSEQMYRRKATILNLQKSMIVVTDGKKIIDANNSMLEFFGFINLSSFSVEHDCICDYFLYKDGFDFVQKEQFGQNWVDYVLQNPQKAHKVLLQDKFGNEKIFDIKLSILDFEHKNHEVIAVLSDITETEHRNMELERFIDATLEGIFISKNGIITDINKVGLNLLGYTNKNELLGSKVMNLVADDSKELVMSNIIKDNAEPYEINMFNRSGEKIPVLVRGQNLTIANKIVRISAVMDLSHIKYLEDASRQKDKMMFHQSKMAAMGEMIGNIAHQWRQPLSAISVAASGMKMQHEYGLLDDKNLMYAIDGIVKNSQLLSQTIDDFRDFFKTDKEEHLINLCECVQKTIHLLEASFKNQDIVFIYDKCENIETLALGNELTQGIMNILNNSKDILSENNEDKEKIIWISVYEKDYMGVIEIFDNGGGVPNTIIDRIFEPYFTTKHQAQGTGIGLYMTKEIITKHLGGRISVKNEQLTINGIRHRGAKFILEIPIK